MTTPGEILSRLGSRKRHRVVVDAYVFFDSIHAQPTTSKYLINVFKNQISVVQFFVTCNVPNLWIRTENSILIRSTDLFEIDLPWNAHCSLSGVTVDDKTGLTKSWSWHTWLPGI